MNKRQIIAAIMAVIGTLLLFGAVGSVEFGGVISAGEFIARAAIGIALIGAAVPVSGDIDDIAEKEGEKHDTRRR